MAVPIVFGEGFQVYPTGTTDLGALGRWSSGSTVGSIVITGTNAYATSPSLTKSLGAGGETALVGLRWRTDQTGSADKEIVALKDSGGTTRWKLERLGASGLLRVTREGTPTTLTETNAALALGTGADYIIEIAARLSGATGAHGVKVNKSTQTALTATTTLTARTITQVSFSSGADTRVSWLWIRNGSGAYIASEFLGRLNRATLRPSSMGDYAGANWGTGILNAIDEPNLDGDVTYAVDATAPTSVAADRFSVYTGGIAGEISSIPFVQPVVAWKRANATAATGRIMLSQGTTDSAGSSESIGTDYGYAYRTLATDPVGSGAWTNAKITATNWGIEALTITP